MITGTSIKSRRKEVLLNKMNLQKIVLILMTIAGVVGIGEPCETHEDCAIGFCFLEDSGLHKRNTCVDGS